MKELYWKGLAIRQTPSHGGRSRKGRLQALTGERIGWAIEPRNFHFRGANAVRGAEGNTGRSAIARTHRTPRGRRPHACTDASCTGIGRPWSWPRLGVVVRSEKPQGTNH